MSGGSRFDEYLDRRSAKRGAEPPSQVEQAEPAQQRTLLELQRSAGNHAVARLLQRMPFEQFVKSTPARKGAFVHEVGKGDLHRFLLQCGQEKRWVEARLRALDDSWSGLFTTYGGKWEYEGPANPNAADPPELQDIRRTLDEAGSGRLKRGVIDYAGDNQRHGKYRWCTQSFVEKHVLEEDRHKSAEKQGKARMAGSPNIAANSVIAAGSMREFQAEVAARQAEFKDAYAQASETAYQTGTVNRGVDFHTNSRYEVVTFEAAEEKAFRALGNIHFSVVQIGEEYLVNHFAGVT